MSQLTEEEREKLEETLWDWFDKGQPVNHKLGVRSYLIGRMVDDGFVPVPNLQIGMKPLGGRQIIVMAAHNKTHVRLYFIAHVERGPTNPEIYITERRKPDEVNG